jgi:hypothetical protein
MGVRLNATGNHNPATGVEHLLGHARREQPRHGDGDNLLAHNPDIPVPHPSRGNDASALNEHIQHDVPPDPMD